MGTASFEQGAIVRVNGVEHRLFRQIDHTFWQLEDVRTRCINTFSKHELWQMYADQTLTFPSTLPVSAIHAPIHVLAPEDLEKAKIRRMYVLAILDVPNSRAPMGERIREVWLKLNKRETMPSHITVYRWKMRYLRSNCDIRALVDDTKNKGNRKRRYSKEVIAICNQAIAKIYMRRERGTITATLDDALNRVMRENAALPKEYQLELPTRRMLRRLIKDIPAFDKYAARHGHDAARNVFRSAKGHTVTSAPLERAEIDHSELDVFIVDEENRLPLGRPYITVCIDCYTRCILGVYIGFTPPGIESVVKCLKDCFRPKVNLNKEYPDIVNEWSAFGVMRQLVVDGGNEFHSHSMEQICLALSIEWQTAPRKTPWFKGTIERFIGTMNRSVCHTLPGTTFASISDKGDYNAEKHACMTMTELRGLVYKWIVDVYHQQLHSVLHTTPAKMWESSIRDDEIRLPSEDTPIDEMVGRLFPNRALRHTGITFRGLHYNSAQLDALRAREGSKIHVDVRVNESNLEFIYVRDPKTMETYKVPALEHDYAAGLSFWNHRVIRRNARTAGKNAENIQDLVRAKADIQQKIEESRQLTRKKQSKRAARFTQGISPSKPQTPAHVVVGDSLHPALASSVVPMTTFESEPQVSLRQDSLRSNDYHPVFHAMERKGS